MDFGVKCIHILYIKKVYKKCKGVTKGTIKTDIALRDYKQT